MRRLRCIVACVIRAFQCVVSSVAVLTAVAACPVGAGAEGAPSTQSAGCVMVARSAQATVEVRIRNAADFCELAAQALASEVFREPLVVIDGSTDQAAATDVSCRLRYRKSDSRITIRNSPAACRWFARPNTGWHPYPPTSPIKSNDGV
jgi:hypothetical protein